jgi:hypothetical protein
VARATTPGLPTRHDQMQRPLIETNLLAVANLTKAHGLRSSAARVGT